MSPNCQPAASRARCFLIHCEVPAVPIALLIIVSPQPSSPCVNQVRWRFLCRLCKHVNDDDGTRIHAASDSSLHRFVFHAQLLASRTNDGHRARLGHSQRFTFLKHPNHAPALRRAETENGGDLIPPRSQTIRLRWDASPAVYVGSDIMATLNFIDQSSPRACRCQSAAARAMPAVEKSITIVPSAPTAIRPPSSGSSACSARRDRLGQRLLEIGHAGRDVVGTAWRMNCSPMPVQLTAQVALSAYVPAPTIGESPTRPYFLFVRPPVEVPAARLPCVSRATQPTVP